MLNKTKAALQSCQCHYQMFKQEQNTRVSAGGQSLSELQNGNSVLKDFSSNRGEVSKTYIRQWRTLDHTAKNNPNIGWYQPFGSMPPLSNSLRSSRLIQPDLLSSPSSFIAIASRSDSSLSSLSCTTWRSLLSFVDIVNSCDLVCSGVDNVLHCMTSSKAKPAGATNTNGPLTKPLSEVTVMADQQHTQTRPKYTWRFLALNRLDKNAKPCRISVEAETEL